MPTPNNDDQFFFFNEEPIQRINNSLTPIQAIRIINDSIKSMEELNENDEVREITGGYEHLIKQLKELKEWMKSRN